MKSCMATKYRCTSCSPEKLFCEFCIGDHSANNHAPLTKKTSETLNPDGAFRVGIITPERQMRGGAIPCNLTIGPPSHQYDNGDV